MRGIYTVGAYRADGSRAWVDIAKGLEARHALIVKAQREGMRARNRGWGEALPDRIGPDPVKAAEETES